MNIFSLAKGKKSRKYPVQFDNEGQSLRKRAFELFDKSLRPADVCKQIPIEVNTCYRYWAEWKKSPPNLNQRYKFLRKLLKNNTGLREKTIERLADYYQISRDEVIRRFQQPHGTKRFLLNKWPSLYPNENMPAADDRLSAALTLIDILNTGEESYQELKDLLNQFSARKREHKQPAKSVQIKYDNNHDYVEPVSRFNRRPSPRFYPPKMTPALEEQLEQYIIKKQQGKDFQSYSNIISLMVLCGIPEEQADFPNSCQGLFDLLPFLR